MLNKVEKRNGAVVDFDRLKVEDAIFKALVATHDSKSRKNLRKLAEVATDYTIETLVEICNNHITPKVEDIQDGVEVVLMKMGGEYDTAKKYIKYRYEHKKLRETKKNSDGYYGHF